jgi:glycosyltransferase involved in cell wall biosynthesis
MNKVVFFVFDPSPRIERRIEDFIDAGLDVDVYGYKYDVVNVDYCNSPKYTYNVIETIPHAVSYKRRLAGLKKIKEIVRRYDKKNTIFYFFSLNVAAIAPFLHIKYVYEESDMLFDRFGNKLARRLVIAFNKHVIKRSAIAVMTSEGFAEFYYGDKRPNNIEFVLNKVNAKCLSLPPVEKLSFDVNHIRFGFAGNIRYKATLNLAAIIAKCYSNHEFHFYGNTESLPSSQLDVLKTYPNIVFHGLFKNPVDLPRIYASMDFCVCNYDITGVNPRYAEPNKLYEALFFDTPILVSPHTFIGKKVKEQKVGFEIDSYDETLVKNTIDSLDQATYNELVNRIKLIKKETLITDNALLVNRIKSIV